MAKVAERQMDNIMMTRPWKLKLAKGKTQSLVPHTHLPFSSGSLDMMLHKASSAYPMSSASLLQKKPGKAETHFKST